MNHYRNMSIVPRLAYSLRELTRNPSPWNRVDVAAKTITRIVAATVAMIESNMRCPSQRPAGFDSPFENCIACTEDLRSWATYSVKNAGKMP